jgi:hypothetical protein
LHGTQPRTAPSSINFQAIERRQSSLPFQWRRPYFLPTFRLDIAPASLRNRLLCALHSGTSISTPHCALRTCMSWCVVCHNAIPARGVPACGCARARAQEKTRVGLLVCGCRIARLDQNVSPFAPNPFLYHYLIVTSSRFTGSEKLLQEPKTVSFVPFI